MLEGTRLFDNCYVGFTNMNIDDYNNFAYFSQKEEAISIIDKNLN